MMNDGPLTVRRVLPWVAALLMLSLLLWLGNWQLERAGEKRELGEVYTAAMAAQPSPVASASALAHFPRFTPVLLKGRFVADRQALLDAQTWAGRVGYRVWTPLELEDGGWVLVDRGWVAAGGDRASFPDLTVADDARELVGFVAPLPAPGLRLAQPDPGGPGWPRLLTWPDDGVVAQAWSGRAPGLLVLLADSEPDGFIREWNPVEGMPPERHLGYAVQWFGLAVALVVIVIVMVVRSRREVVDG